MSKEYIYFCAFDNLFHYLFDFHCIDVFISWFKLIPKCLKILSSYCDSLFLFNKSLLIYKNLTFCVLILYLVAWLHRFIDKNSFLVGYLDFYLYKIMSSTHIDILTSWFTTLIVFISLSLTLLAFTSNAILSNGVAK